MGVQQYILEEYKNGNQKILIYDLKRLERDDGLPLKSNARIKQEPHIGKYWLCVQKLKKVNAFWNFEVMDSKYYSFNKLKSLKKLINKLFGYNHYKIELG